MLFSVLNNEPNKIIQNSWLLTPYSPICKELHVNWWNSFFSRHKCHWSHNYSSMIWQYVCLKLLLFIFSFLECTALFLLWVAENGFFWLGRSNVCWDQMSIMLTAGRIYLGSKLDETPLLLLIGRACPLWAVQSDFHHMALEPLPFRLGLFPAWHTGGSWGKMFAFIILAPWLLCNSLCFGEQFCQWRLSRQNTLGKQAKKGCGQG